jgi:hypothetical protein
MWGSLTEPLKRLSFCGSFILLNHYSSPAPGLGHATLFLVGRSIADRRHHVIPSYDRWACVDGFDSISLASTTQPGRWPGIQKSNRLQKSLLLVLSKTEQLVFGTKFNFQNLRKNLKTERFSGLSIGFWLVFYLTFK